MRNKNSTITYSPKYATLLLSDFFDKMSFFVVKLIWLQFCFISCNS